MSGSCIFGILCVTVLIAIVIIVWRNISKVWKKIADEAYEEELKKHEEGEKFNEER